MFEPEASSYIVFLHLASPPQKKMFFGSITPPIYLLLGENVMVLKIVALFVLGAVALWLLLWDFIDFLTQGLNNGVWDFVILQNGFPSIATGFCLLIVVSFLGLHIIKG